MDKVEGQSNVQSQESKERATIRSSTDKSEETSSQKGKK